MKIHRILILAIAMLSLSVAASAGNDENPIVKASEARKGWWQFGATARVSNHFFYTNEQSVVLGAGYRFNKKNYLGMNIGVAKASDTYKWDGPGETFYYTACPITLDYTHNFFLGKAKKHSIYLGAELGGLFSFGQTAMYQPLPDDPYEEVPLGSPITNLKFGMDFQLYKKLHLNFGVSAGVLALGAGIGLTYSL